MWFPGHNMRWVATKSARNRPKRAVIVIARTKNYNYSIARSTVFFSCLLILVSSLPTSSAPISEAFSIALEPRSLLLFTGRAYTEFTHGIQPTRVHAIGDVVNFDRIDSKNINHPKNDTCEARHDSDDDARDNGSNGASDDDKLQDRTQSGPIHSYRHFRCGRRLSLTCRRVKKELIARMTMNTLIRL